jgi:hypothetical protein
MIATLVLPQCARGVVLFVDEQDSGKFALRQHAVSRMLQDADIATVQINLLTAEEQGNQRRAGYLRNDVELLASRVVTATDWLADAPATQELPLGYFATGISAAAVLAAAAERPYLVSAIVTNGGRPLLVRPALPQIRAPTLLIARASDAALVKLNHSALAQMLCEKCLEVVPGVDEPSQAEQAVARLAREWFERHLVKP